MIFSGFCLLAAVVNGLSSSESESTGVVKMVYPLVPGYSRKSHNHFKEETCSVLNKSKAPKKVKSVKTAKSRSSLVDKISYDVLGPVKSYDRDFMGEWWKMMRQLWTADGEANGIRSEMPSSAVDFLPRENEKLYRANKVVAHWFSPDCKFLDLNLKPIKTLQDGSSNQVILMKDANTHKRYVIKTISNPDAFFNELSVFMFIDQDHPYFSRAVCHRRNKEENRAKVIFEYVNGIESLEFARTASLTELKTISAQLFLALEHLHYLKFIHADMKPHNVLIDHHGNVKVIDFGFSAQLPYGKTSQGTHFTMAPELHEKVPGAVHEGVDWWAYGSTVAMWFGAYYDEKKYAESHNGQPSGRKGHKNTCVLMNWAGKRFEAGRVPKEFPEDLRSFLYMFHFVDPDTRSFNTPRLLKMIRNHRFFSDINWSELHGGEFGKLYPIDN